MLVRAVVVDNKDPLHRGRIKIRAYGWHDEIPDDDLPWAEPCMPFGGDKDYGTLLIPETGSTVWISFEVDDTFKPNPMCPVWVGVWWGQSEVPSESQDGTYQTHAVVKTKKGHKVIVSDANDIIEVTTAQGDRIVLDGVNRTISVQTKTFSHAFDSGQTVMTSWNISGDVTINGNLTVKGEITDIKGSLTYHTNGGLARD